MPFAITSKETIIKKANQAQQRLNVMLSQLKVERQTNLSAQSGVTPVMDTPLVSDDRNEQEYKCTVTKIQMTQRVANAEDISIMHMLLLDQ